MRRKKMHNTIVAGKIYYFNYYIFAYTGVAHLEEINRNMRQKKLRQGIFNTRMPQVGQCIPFRVRPNDFLKRKYILWSNSLEIYACKRNCFSLRAKATLRRIIIFASRG